MGDFLARFVNKKSNELKNTIRKSFVIVKKSFVDMKKSSKNTHSSIGIVTISENNLNIVSI